MQNNPLQNNPQSTDGQSNPTVLKIIWLALFISQLLYLFVVHVTSKPYEVEPRLFDLADPLTMPFATMAVVATIASFTLPKFLMSKVTKDAQPNALKRFFVPFIIRLALLESITLYGFVLAILHHDPRRMLIFMCVSLIGFIVSYPSEERIESGF